MKKSITLITLLAVTINTHTADSWDWRSYVPSTESIQKFGTTCKQWVTENPGKATALGGALVGLGGLGYAGYRSLNSAKSTEDELIYEVEPPVTPWADLPKVQQWKSEAEAAIRANNTEDLGRILGAVVTSKPNYSDFSQWIIDLESVYSDLVHVGEPNITTAEEHDLMARYRDITDLLATTLSRYHAKSTGREVEPPVTRWADLPIVQQWKSAAEEAIGTNNVEALGRILSVVVDSKPDFSDFNDWIGNLQSTYNNLIRAGDPNITQTEKDNLFMRYKAINELLGDTAERYKNTTDQERRELEQQQKRRNRFYFF